MMSRAAKPAPFCGRTTSRQRVSPGVVLYQACWPILTDTCIRLGGE